MHLERLTFAVAAPVVAAAGLGGLASGDAPETYRRLDKPIWAPPASAFGPVWTALFAGTAVAGWLLATEIALVRRDTPAAAALLTPYLAWTGFATALDAAVSEPTDS